MIVIGKFAVHCSPKRRLYRWGCCGVAIPPNWYLYENYSTRNRRRFVTEESFRQLFSHYLSLFTTQFESPMLALRRHMSMRVVWIGKEAQIALIWKNVCVFVGGPKNPWKYLHRYQSIYFDDKCFCLAFSSMHYHRALCSFERTYQRESCSQKGVCGLEEDVILWARWAMEAVHTVELSRFHNGRRWQNSYYRTIHMCTV